MTEEKKKKQELLDFVRNNVVGRDAQFKGPFGTRKLIYCDYTASGKPLEYIEKYIADHVYPYYANTHTTTSLTGLQTSEFRASARRLIKKSINAGKDDVVIFTGSGVTAAIHKLIHALQLEGDAAKNTVVMVGPYEHHSNILPWKETGATVERIPDKRHGLADMEILEAKLKEYKERGFHIIVSFSAASNITGIVTDTEAVAALTHKYGGFSFWDYAAAAPYLQIDMNPANKESSKDAVFISPHKFVGGVGTPGILAAKKHLFTNPVPGGCGGGTVVYVTKETHEYHVDIEEREEGGTPAIVESIRAGMVFQIKDAIGANVIAGLEEDLSHAAFSRWRRNRCIHLLGSFTARRIPIFSMMIFHPESGHYMHHNFISALMNDLYGIQVRGGCACSGPYAQDLMNMDEQTAMRFTTEFLTESRREDTFKRLEIMKPGFVRLNLPYFMDKETCEFILNAVDTVATHGWKLLPQYRYDPVSGEWAHRSNIRPDVQHLEDLTITGQGCTIPESATIKDHGNITLEQVEAEVKVILEKAKQSSADSGADNDEDLPIKEELKNIVWFLTPKQAALYIKSPYINIFTEGRATKPLPMSPRHESTKDVKHKFMQAFLKAEQLGLVEKHHSQEQHTSSKSHSSSAHLLIDLGNDSGGETSPPPPPNNPQLQRIEDQMSELSREVTGVVRLMGELYKDMTSLKKEVKALKEERRSHSPAPQKMKTVQQSYESTAGPSEQTNNIIGAGASDKQQHHHIAAHSEQTLQEHSPVPQTHSSTVA